MRYSVLSFVVFEANGFNGLLCLHSVLDMVEVLSLYMFILCFIMLVLCRRQGKVCYELLAYSIFLF